MLLQRLERDPAELTQSALGLDRDLAVICGAVVAFVDEHAFRALNLREMLDSDVVLALDLK